MLETRTATRRAQYKVRTVPTTHECPNCGNVKMLHRACPTCGHYRGRVIVEKPDYA